MSTVQATTSPIPALPLSLPATAASPQAEPAPAPAVAAQRHFSFSEDTTAYVSVLARDGHQRPALHQAVVLRPEPPGARPLEVTPPTFRWPIAELDQQYSIQYGRHRELADGDTSTVRGIASTFYRPTEPLAPGVWYWRYRVDDGPWCAPITFDVPASAVRWPIPPWSQTVSRIPGTHPRLWLRPDTLDPLRRRFHGDELAALRAAWLGAGYRHVGEPLALERDTPRVEVTDVRAKILRRSAAGRDARQTFAPVSDLALLALLTHDDRLAGEAIRRVLCATRLDPDGYTSHDVSDFANGAILRAAAMVYDYLQPALDSEQRTLVQDVITQRATRLYRRYRPAREVTCPTTHAWQHIMADLLAGGLAVYGEVPEAREWVEWALQMFVAHYPWWGGADGGSAEGPHYFFGMGFLSSQATAALVRGACDLDLMRHPWFAGSATYAIYAHPPAGPRSRFGDGGGVGRVHPDVAVAMYRLGRRFHNPSALAYASRVAGQPASFYARLLTLLPVEDDDPATSTPTGATPTGATPTGATPTGATPTGGSGNAAGNGRSSAHSTAFPQPEPLSGLPKARAFADIGVVSMHSAIDRPDDNVALEFKSSPYGSFGHAHADQNSINITAFGEPLVIDSGYYTQYGDEHHVGWTITTQAHNALLIDGHGQASRNLDAFGQINDVFTGERHHYAAGSAARAYHAVSLARFVRHVLWIEPHAYLVYDVVDSEAATDVQWLLHTPARAHLRRVGPFHDSGDGPWLHASTSTACLDAFFAFPERVTLAQTNQFSVPAEKWAPGQASASYPDQWHITASHGERSTRHRWLTALFVSRKQGHARPHVARVSGGSGVGIRWSPNASAGEATIAAFATSAEAPRIALGTQVPDAVAGEAAVAGPDVRGGRSNRGARAGVGNGAAIEADAAAIVVSGSADAPWLMVAGRLLRHGGRTLVSSNRPATVELVGSDAGGRVNCRTSLAVNLEVALRSRPREVRVGGLADTPWRWHAGRKALLIALPAGSSTVTFAY